MLQHQGRTVLFVGSRRGALAAAERLGLRVLLVTDRAPARARRPKLAGWAEVDLRARPPAEVAAAALELCARERVEAVLALTEFSAVAAAEVRAALGLPGLGPEQAWRCRDKLLMKQCARAAGVRCADTVEIGPATTAAELVERLGLPLVIKQRAGAGGRGTVLARDLAAVAAALQPGWLAEAFVDGIEMSVETLQAAGQVLFVNPTEYLRPGWASIVPAALQQTARSAALDLNRRALAALGIAHGMTHLELFLTPRGPVLGEVAARPPGGFLMDLIGRAYGFDPWEALLRVELGEQPALPRTAGLYAGAWLLHPGGGTVRAVAGLEQARAVAGVEEVRCSLAIGQPLAPRTSTAQWVGRILACGRERDAVAAALERAASALRIEMA
ncbi:MAG: argininosuccinate lyase [Planctomycetota bacterium]|nr:MAG: argininosuccinate lyase [Planctomycetota bacterium]